MSRKEVETWVDDVLAPLESRGVVETPKPKKERRFPVDLTALSNHDLRKLQSYFRAMLGYYINQAARAKIAVHRAERQYRKVHQKWTLKKDPGDRSLTKDSVDALVHEVKEVKEWDETWSIMRADSIEFESKVEEYRGYLETISREFTCREVDLKYGIE